MISRLLPKSLLSPRRLYATTISIVESLETVLRGETDDQLRQRSLSLRHRVRCREPMSRCLPEGCALVRVAAERTIGLRPYDEQLLGGLAMLDGGIAEMQTGEGKTLAATVPLYLRALAGRGAHLATANDYLAARDAAWMGPIFQRLGLSVGVVLSKSTRQERRAAYACDITYGTAKQFGFDFLRDRLGASRTEIGLSTGQPVQRQRYFALLDEADSLLLDEARSALIIDESDDPPDQVAIAGFRWAAKVAGEFREETHYLSEHPSRTVHLTARGRELVRSLPKPSVIDPLHLQELYELVERAIRAARDFVRDRQYIVRDGEVVIVDEYTGRLAEGRKWRDGLHQAIEAKEGLEITARSRHAAQISVQDFFLGYPHLTGMTGTAANARRELKALYRLPVVGIPTHRPCRRVIWPSRIFGSRDAKWRAIVESVRELHEQGRPVLIGTRSIDKSQDLSDRLTSAGLPHFVLNAHATADEAQIIAQAGQTKRITVATNMAGRGTDIRLGEGVAELGGLHVIGTELHESSRIDRQLAGRCGRQGDPGTFQQFLALDDELLTVGLGPERARELRKLGAVSSGPFERFLPDFLRAQRAIERRHFRERQLLLHIEHARHRREAEMGHDAWTSRG